ncbi:octopamine receptor 1-like [Actinia tenebrosa]|uniref:Octopamine receptor 1-like n=1 Tax=Actinia tenebrosa TaxID=6105 RepID=A0A6P8IR95_ACTTE|nr:octopamine receptor 1-like [Actinia tenebrosa]XP_031569469.1 octopamine receptor 1-like [Actinia tenebrosa]
MNNTTTVDPFALCKNPTSPWFIVYTTFLVLILLATLFGNGLVVLSVYVFARLRRVSNMFIVSLAVSDLLVALASLPLRIDQSVHNMNWCSSTATCVFWVSTDGIWSAASICNLVIISIDRFLAITKPFAYQEKMTKTVCLGLITFVWVYAVTWGLLSLIYWSNGEEPAWTGVFSTGEHYCQKNDRFYYTATFVFAIFIPLVIIIITYASIFKVALMQAKMLASQDPTRRGHRRSVRELKATKTIAIVIGVFVVCWLPAFVIITISLWCSPNDCFSGFAKYPAFSLAIRIPFVFVLPILNSSVNPIIYAVYNKEFRDAFRKMLRLDSGRQSGADYLEEYSCTEPTHVRRLLDSNSKGSRIDTNMNGGSKI